MVPRRHNDVKPGTGYVSTGQLPPAEILEPLIDEVYERYKWVTDGANSQVYQSGIGGGIVTVSPGKGGLGTFSPPLDSAGNSVRSQLVARLLSQKFGTDLFVSRPASSSSED